jgi:ubiquinone/menaquinone biosynthesis C-methylase UbiE
MMSPRLVDDKFGPSYHEVVFAKNKLRSISPEDSILLSLENAVSPKQNEMMIELGCGSGLRSLHISKKYFLEPVLIDFTNVAASLSKENAQRLGVSCHIVRCDLRYLPLRNALFDIVWAEGPHEHLLMRERQQGFNETRRVAKRGARLMIFVPNTLNLFYRVEEFLKEKAHFAELYETVFTRDELAAYISAAGFKLKGRDGLEVLYPLFSYSLFSLDDLPPVIRSSYRIKSYATHSQFARRGLVSTALRLLRRLDRRFLPRHLLGLEIGIIAEAI